MILKSFLRLLCAGGLCLLSFAFLSPGGDNGLAAMIAIVGIVWGIIELFILSGLLLLYGVSGIVHDIGAINERDPWNRW